MKQKSIYQDSSMNLIITLFILASLMIGFSLYLTNHYFSLKFPTGLEGNSLCNFSSIFNCDKTTMSPLSNIAGVPISVLGALIGLFTLAGLFIKNLNFEKTVYFFLIVNFVGCVLLFFYSLFILKGLCPFCTLYYIVSGITLWLFYKNSESFKPHLITLFSLGFVLILVGFLTKMNVDKKIENMSAVANDLIHQYYALPNLGMPTLASEFKLASAENAPIKLAFFSDFECPACKALSDMVPLMLTRYGGLIDIQYYYYPLDNNCNPSMDRPLHQQACRAAYYSTCMGADKFGVVHDEIFHNQNNLGNYLDEQIKKNQMEACVSDPKTKEKVMAIINASQAFNIRSTPTYLLNGVKIEGALPPDQLFAILDEIVKRSKN